ncbi:MAG: ABC transporter ATP-binding protein/permease [Lentisphaerales bacterium]|nr:ABC transporter ATP-binding protein/permease [Lentisphaerales bacterium]
MYQNTTRFLKEYLPGKGRGYSIGIFCLVITIVATTSIPLYIEDAINILSSANEKLTQEQSSVLIHSALCILGLGVLLCIARVLSRILIFIQGRIIEADVRQDLFSAVVNMPMDVLAKYQSGDLISRGTNDVTSVRVMISMGILHSINSSLMLIFCLYYMFSISARLTLICLIPLPLIILGTRMLSKRMMIAGRESQTQLGTLSETTRELFRAHTLLTIFPVFNLLIEKFNKDNDLYRSRAERLLSIRVLMMIMVASILSLGLFILLHFGGPEAIETERLGEDGFNIGAFTAFSLFLGVIQGPLRAIGFLFPLLQRGEICLTRIYEVRDAEKNAKDIEEKRPIKNTTDLQTQKSTPLIEIRDLNFSYDDNDNNFKLQVPSLKIIEGKKYGIFGHTGCGKTTLFNLLCANLRSSGLFYQGTPYESITTEALNRTFSIVPQENRHFSKTINENIHLVTDNNDNNSQFKTNFDTAYEISQLQGDVEQFNDGLDTLLGEHGINLSGGQKQRLSILRALIKSRNIVLMDDFVSAVDHKTENKIIDGLYSKLKNETMIMISHRISALIQCDEILIMENGKIIEQGSHEELLSKNEIYRKTFEHQTLEKQIEGEL